MPLDREMVLRVCSSAPGLLWPPEGWVELVTNMIEEMEATGEGVSIFQIKEKFGVLQVYESERRHQEIIRKYESLSTRTCQACGNDEASERTIEGWMYTLCDECTEEMLDIDD